jgi:hypothetical protein
VEPAGLWEWRIWKMVDLSAMEVHAAPRVFLAEEDKGVEDLILLSILLDWVFLGDDRLL